jgi:hypothetical protein
LWIAQVFDGLPGRMKARLRRAFTDSGDERLEDCADLCAEVGHALSKPT